MDPFRTMSSQSSKLPITNEQTTKQKWSKKVHNRKHMKPLYPIIEINTEQALLTCNVAYPCIDF